MVMPEPNSTALLEKEIQAARKKLSEYAMSFDLLTKIAHSFTEQEAIESILAVFDQLFSPRTLVFVSLSHNQPDKVYALSPLLEDEHAIKDRLQSFTQEHAWTTSKKGFQVMIRFQKKVLGVLEVDHVKFPQEKDRYLNLTLSMAEVCGLAIENARRYQKIKDTENKLRNEKEKLEAALAEVKKLSGLIPICGHCKKIRDDTGYWNQVEAYIEEHSEAQFSHGICQDCAEKYYPGYNLYEEEEKE
jgi:transcriptional regulator with GAF, ATPase, and Fis domain